MNTRDPHLSDQEKRERLALLALAADRQKSTGECPDDERFAEFLEADPRAPEQQAILEHLSGCDVCRRKWLTLSEELAHADAGGRRGTSRFGRRNLLGALGSACAVALGVMLYLSIDYHSPSQQEALLTGSALKQDTVSESARPQKSVPELADQDLEAGQSLQPQEPALMGKPPAEPLARRQSDEQEQHALEQRVITGMAEPRIKSMKPEMAAAPQLETKGKDAEDRGADTALNLTKPAPALTEELSLDTAASGAEYQEALITFFMRFTESCEARKRGDADGGVKEVTELGRDLLKFAGGAQVPYKELIEQIVKTLQLEDSDPEKNFSGLCEQAIKVRDEIAPPQQ